MNNFNCVQSAKIRKASKNYYQFISLTLLDDLYEKSLNDYFTLIKKVLRAELDEQFQAIELTALIDATRFLSDMLYDDCEIEKSIFIGEHYKELLKFARDTLNNKWHNKCILYLGLGW